MDRLLLTMVVLAFFLLCVWGMRRGWRRQAREQSVKLDPFPTVPEDTGEAVLPDIVGLYASTTLSGRWQDRVVTRGVGLRSSVTLRCFADGIEVERVGAPGFWIPRESIVDARVGKAIAGKVMGTNSLLVVTWQLGDRLLDTGVRGDDLELYPSWIDTLVGTASARTETGEVNGGTRS